MKWAGEQVRKGLYDVMTGLGIPTFDFTVPSEKRTATYAIIGTYGQSSEGSKDKFSHTVTVDIELHQVFQGQFGGRKAIDNLTNQVLNALRPTTTSYGLSVTGFQVQNISLLTSVGGFNSGDVVSEFANILTLEINLNE